MRNGVRVYRTAQGDMWDSIALRELGAEHHMHLLIDANLQYVDIAVFPANCELIIPEITTTERITFPPWRDNG